MAVYLHRHFYLIKRKLPMAVIAVGIICFDRFAVDVYVVVEQDCFSDKVGHQLFRATFECRVQVFQNLLFALCGAACAFFPYLSKLVLMHTILADISPSLLSCLASWSEVFPS